MLNQTQNTKDQSKFLLYYSWLGKGVCEKLPPSLFKRVALDNPPDKLTDITTGRRQVLGRQSASDYSFHSVIMFPETN